MFVFDNVSDKDARSYSYELYEADQVSGSYPNISPITNATIYSSGTFGSNVFTVAVENSTDSTTKRYFGRIRTIDSSNNPSSWSPIVQSDQENPLISNQYIASLTAAKITAGTIGAHEIILTQAGAATAYSAPANTAVIRSSNYSANTAGWLIRGDGFAEFDQAAIRGTVKAGAVFIDEHNRWKANTTGSVISTAEFKVGNATKYVYWDGTNLTFTGNLSAAGGTFSGNLSAAGGTFSGELSGGTISIGSGNSIFKADSNGIYLGNSTFSSAPFRVTPQGGLVASNANITGTINATSGTFSGSLNAATGTFAGDLSAAGGTFSGDLSAAGGTFSGDLSAAGGTFSGDLSAAGGTFTGDLSAAGGTFSGDLSAAGGTFTGTLSGVDGTFTGSLSAGQISGGTLSGVSIDINSNFRVDGNGTVECRNITVDSGLTYRGQNFATSASTSTARVDNIGVDRFVKVSSRREYKENIVDISNALKIVNQLKPRKFNFKQSYFGEIDPSTEKPWTAEARAIQSLFSTYGFIVDEVQEVDPGLVAYEPSEVGNLDISQWKACMWKDLEIIALLTKAVQELSNRIDELEKQ
jgi:cytoskeletal protein CcmA (bactofilin family)